MNSVDKAMDTLCRNIRERGQRAIMDFRSFMSLAAERPEIVFRNIFQVFHDMVMSYVGDGVDEYPDDPESIHYISYDCSRLFVDGTDYPFFADRLFANRFVNHVASLRQGAQQNRIYIFEGPHGCGKSTFLNNLLLRFEQYAKTDEGASFETVWRLDRKALGGAGEQEAHVLLMQLKSLVDAPNGPGSRNGAREGLQGLQKKASLEVPCPSHDHPLLLVPKPYRREVCDEMITDDAFRERLFHEKSYEWVFRDQPCTICTSLYQTLLDMLGSPSKVFEMVFARRSLVNRRLGEGISVFNPGDKGAKTNVITNQVLQNQLDSLLRDSNRVRYLYSRYAKTNNGIYALMDVKAHNRERFANLHGIISEGVHKVDDMEENVNSLFLALMNPEDEGHIEDAQSFSDRIIYIKIPYVLDYNTEVKIYKSVFGDRIEKGFLPRVLQNFAKMIISTRLAPRSEALLEWIGDPARYRLYCDERLQLLKMDIYAGLIPLWLTEEDRKRFTAARRRAIIRESESEGDQGFSGRDSIKIFNDFHSTYAKPGSFVSMAMVFSFFSNYRKDLSEAVPWGFLESLVRSYNYTVLQEVKESLYSYNEERISRDIQNYLFAVNFEFGTVHRCVFTGEEISVSEPFFEDLEQRLLGVRAGEEKRRAFRADVQAQYASRTLTQEMLMEGKGICETEIYRSLYERYVYNLKEKVMDPFLRNDNFRRAIRDYGTPEFRTYDRRIQDEVGFLVANLSGKYGYTEQGAKEVCIYVVDNDLARAFSGE
jgi:predicted Ser/Thr protein kinase